MGGMSRVSKLQLLNTKTLSTLAWPGMSTKEVTNDYSIRIIEDIHDPDLVRHWKRIAEETDCFPQMFYEWCELWWRLQSKKQELHILAVEDENARIAGIPATTLANERSRGSCTG